MHPAIALGSCGQHSVSLPLSGKAMDSSTRSERPRQAPPYHNTEGAQPSSSTASLTEEDVMGVSTCSGWKLDEVMDARQALAAAAASLQRGSNRNDFIWKPWPSHETERVVSLHEIVAQHARISLATSDHPRPRLATRHKKRKGAATAGAPQEQPQGLAGLADVASMLTPEPSSKRTKTGPPVGMPIIGQAGGAATSEAAVSAKHPVGQKDKKCLPKTQLEELPYRRADGKWTCTFSTGGMNKDRLTLCCRENEAKRSLCKACKAPRWDWQLHARLAAILQHRDLHAFSLQQVVDELNKMSLGNFEGLRFPVLAVKHEVDAFLASGHAGKLRQPAKVASLPVFPMGLREGCYHVEERQAAGSTKLHWARNRGESAEHEVSLEEELATDFGSLNSSPLMRPTVHGIEAGFSQQEVGDAQWQPLYCALLRLAQSVLMQQSDQSDGTSADRLPDALGSLSNAEEAAEDCCAFAHSLLEATLRRRWPSRLKLKKSMKGIQERILQLHLPYPGATEAGSSAAGTTSGDDAAHCPDDDDSVEHVKGVKRPLPFSSRAALLQNPPRRPKGWSAPPLPRPRIKPSGEPMRPEQEYLDTSGIEASAWLLGPPYALHQVQHAFAPPPAVSEPGSAAEPSSSHAARADVSAGGARAGGAASRSADEQEPSAQRPPSFGQWDSAFHPAVAHAALPAPDIAQNTEDSRDAPRPDDRAPRESPSVEGQAHGQGSPGGDTERPPELVNWKTEWMRRLLLQLQQPKVQGLAGINGVRHQAKLVFQAAAVAGVRHEVIESAAKRFTLLQSDKGSKP